MWQNFFIFNGLPLHEFIFIYCHVTCQIRMLLWVLFHVLLEALFVPDIAAICTYISWWASVSWNHKIHKIKRLRWSRGSVLAFGTKVSGFKPSRSCRIFQGEKILSTPSFGREVKPFVPCHRFTACKRSLNVTWKSGIFRQNSSAISRPSSSSFHY